MEMENRGVVKGPPFLWDLNITPPQINYPPAKLITNEDVKIENLGIVNWMPFCWDLNVTPPQIDLPPAKVITNKDGHYIFGIEAYLTPRYKILSKMGAGTFGQVLECWDYMNKETVAVKVSRSLPNHRNAAKGEIDVLLQLAVADKNGEHFVRIQHFFDYHDHICIVFEKLGPSLHDLLQKNHYRPLPLDLVRGISRQLLKSIAVMHDDLQLIHTDLKPENILLVSSDIITVSHLPTSNAIRVIDFGCSAFGYQNHDHLITTRPYRAPEVILGNEWSYPCDMWSIGCILIELCTGQVAFGSSQDLDLEHFVMMEAVLGPLPHQIRTILQEALQSKSSKQYISVDRLIAICMLDRLEDLVMRNIGDTAAANDLVDLLRRLLRYDPAGRLKARDALAHPFFTRR